MTDIASSATGPLSVSASPESRILAMRDRLDIIKQCILRNEHFAPSTIPSRDREKLVTLKSTKQLLGRPDQRFLLLGMLTHNKEGKMCLEDADGSVVLDYSTLVSDALLYDRELEFEGDRTNLAKDFIQKVVLHWSRENIQKTQL